MNHLNSKCILAPGEFHTLRPEHWYHLAAAWKYRFLEPTLGPSESESLGVRPRHQYKTLGDETQVPGNNKRMVNYS